MQKIIEIYKLIIPCLFENRKAKGAAILTLFLIALDVMATTYVPYIWKNLISTSIASRPLGWFLSQTVLLFIAWFFLKNTAYLREITIFSMTNQVIKHLRLKVILKTHTINMLDLAQYNVQEIINCTGRISQSVRNFMRVSFISIFPSIVKIISLSIALLTAHRLCGGMIMAAYVGIGIAALGLRYYTAAKLKAWHLTDNVNVAMAHNLYNTATIRFNPTLHNKELTHLFDLEASAWESFNTIFYSLYLVQNIIFYTGTGSVFFWLMLQYIGGTVPLDTLILVYGLLAAIHHPSMEVLRNLTRFLGGIIDMHKTLAILAIPSANKPLQQVDYQPQSIHLRGITFGYHTHKKILAGIDLTIHPGDKIGIWGTSGTGKSTLCSIMAGLIKADQGNVWYGSLPIDQIASAALGEVLVYIPQLQFVQQLAMEDHAYGIKFRKKALSGGEYQQSLLQEALQKKPQVVILDETFNALDEVTASKLLYQVMEHIPTVIMVSHSKNILRHMPRIFKLQDGKLLETKDAFLAPV